MASTLDEIIAATRKRVERAMRADSEDPAELRQRASAHRPRGFRAALKAQPGRAPAVIAELKQASPSRGVIRNQFLVDQLAAQLQAAGAAALSVLTEPDFFRGSLAYLAQASAATSLPCLRKDFILHEFQLLQARAHGADAVLLIVAALSQAELENLHRHARGLELDVLCEVHTEAELDRALAAGCDLVGVNSRDLCSFHVDRENLFRLAPKLPAGVARVAESGISSAREMRELAAAGYQAFLIGESLMRAESPGAALSQLLADFNSTPAHNVHAIQ